MFINRMSMFNRSLFNKPVESNLRGRTDEMEAKDKKENVRDRNNELESKVLEQPQKPEKNDAAVPTFQDVAKPKTLTLAEWKNLSGIKNASASSTGTSASTTAATTASGPSNGKVSVFGSEAGCQSAEKWAEMGVDKNLLDKFFTEMKLNVSSESEQEYGLRKPYTSMTMTAQGGSLNSGNWKEFTLTLDSKDNAKHTQTVKYYSDGRMETVDNVTTNYSKKLDNGHNATFTQKQLDSLGMNDEMIEKYFENKFGSYILKKPYTSFDVTQMSGDTTQSTKIVFKRNNKTAYSDTYIDGKSKFSSNTQRQTIEKKRI